jgi:hypothetical protein
MEGTSMDGMIKTLMKRLLLMSVCSVGLMTLLAYEFSHGILSPRGLAIALFMLCIAISVGVVLIGRKTAEEFRVPPGPPGASIDTATRKRRLLGIRLAKAWIIILAVGLLVGLRGIGSEPLLPLLVGVAVNLCMMATAIWVVVRLQEGLE